MAAAISLIVGAGIVHGAWTDRWGTSPTLAARYEAVPMVIGDRKGVPMELGAAERKMAGAEAWLSHVYTDPARGVSTSVMLIGGRPGEISTRTPEVCYAGAGYDLGNPWAYDRRYGP